MTQCSSHFVSWRLRSCGRPICSAEWEVKSSRACYRIRHGKTPSGWQSGCVPRSKPPPTRWQGNSLPRQSALASQSRTMRVLISPLCWTRQIRRSIAPRHWAAIVSSCGCIPHSRLLLGKYLGKPLRRGFSGLCLDQEGASETRFESGFGRPFCSMPILIKYPMDFKVQVRLREIG